MIRIPLGPWLCRVLCEWSQRTWHWVKFIHLCIQQSTFYTHSLYSLNTFCNDKGIVNFHACYSGTAHTIGQRVHVCGMSDKQMGNVVEDIRESTWSIDRNCTIRMQLEQPYKSKGYERRCRGDIESWRVFMGDVTPARSLKFYTLWTAHRLPTG